MNTKIKLLSILLALSLVVGGSACSKNNDEKKDGKEGENSTDGTLEEKPFPTPRAFSDKTSVFGSAEFGYLSLPKDWIHYSRIGDESGAVHFSSSDGKYVVSLNYGTGEEFFNEQLEYFTTNPSKDVSTTDDYIGGFETDKITATLTDAELAVTMWQFIDDNGVYRTVMATGNPYQEYHSEIEKLIEESFSFTDTSEDTKTLDGENPDVGDTAQDEPEEASE